MGPLDADMVVPGKGPLPIVDYEGLELTRAARRSDGSYFVTGIDLSDPRDHRTGKPAAIDLHCRWWRESDRGRLLREQSPPPEVAQTIFIGRNYEFAMQVFDDPDVASIPWRSGGVYTFPMPQWQMMGERDGHMLGMTSGQKLRSVKELPREFLARTEHEHPNLLSLDALFRAVPPP